MLCIVNEHKQIAIGFPSPENVNFYNCHLCSRRCLFYDWKLYIYLDDLRKKIKKAHEDRIASGGSLNDDDDQERWTGRGTGIDEEDSTRRMMNDDVLQRAIFHQDDPIPKSTSGSGKSPKKGRKNRDDEADEEEGGEHNEYNTFSETDRFLMKLRAEAGIFDPINGGDDEEEEEGEVEYDGGEEDALLPSSSKKKTKRAKTKIQVKNNKVEDDLDEVRSQMSTDDML